MHDRSSRSDGFWKRWSYRSRRRRAMRALERQLEYQQAKADRLVRIHHQVMDGMQAASDRVRNRVEMAGGLRPNSRVLEVGSGAHGLIFFFDRGLGVGIDPLAVSYAGLFPRWQRRASTIAAGGEQLPLRNASFDVVLCDNVVDHAEDPRRIVEEITRVLAPSGVLYFTVNVHHRFYAVASAIHAAWNSIGLHFEIGPFADHTVHLTPAAAKRLFRSLPLRIVSETMQIDEARATARRTSRHPGDLLKRLFFKNALFEVLAVREQQTSG